jgi:uncharacterized protein (TIGR03435 family)
MSLGTSGRPERNRVREIAWRLAALQEQLGLRLEARKAPVEILVAEHPKKTPAAN